MSPISFIQFQSLLYILFYTKHIILNFIDRHTEHTIHLVDIQLLVRVKLKPSREGTLIIPFL